jgi:hypothetical protein
VRQQRAWKIHKLFKLFLIYLKIKYLSTSHPQEALSCISRTLFQYSKEGGIVDSGPRPATIVIAGAGGVASKP